MVCYDPQYALRLCAERNLDEPCVYIYAAMGLWEESVDLALKVGVSGHHGCMYAWLSLVKLCVGLFQKIIYLSHFPFPSFPFLLPSPPLLPLSPLSTLPFPPLLPLSPLSTLPSPPLLSLLPLSSPLPSLLPLSQVDVELARQIAGSPVRNKDMQKKMWLKVAQHVIKKEENIEK